jgi:hypothetical protein
MQPTKRFNKTLLAGALILGTCNAFTASAANFPVTASAVPDVTAGMVTGYTELSFGAGIIGNKVGESCAMNGSTHIADAALQWDADGGNDDTAEGANYGLLVGNACITTDPGVPMVIEIDGADTSTVTITVADVVGAGYTYKPTDESCVVNFDRGTGVDTCDDFAGNTVTGIGMSLTQTDGLLGAAAETATTFGYAGMSGKTRMVLAGSITIDSEIAAGTVIADSVVVQVTYE